MMNNEYMRRYMAERYEHRMAWAKKELGGKCVVCGTKRDLQFDHIDPSTKLFSIGHKAAGKNLEAFKAEVQKCQLLCRKHHEDKTLRENGHAVMVRGTIFPSKRAAIRHFGIGWKTLAKEAKQAPMT